MSSVANGCGSNVDQPASPTSPPPPRAPQPVQTRPVINRGCLAGGQNTFPVFWGAYSVSGVFLLQLSDFSRPESFLFLTGRFGDPMVFSIPPWVFGGSRRVWFLPAQRAFCRFQLTTGLAETKKFRKTAPPPAHPTATYNSAIEQMLSRSSSSTMSTALPPPPAVSSLSVPRPPSSVPNSQPSLAKPQPQPKPFWSLYNQPPPKTKLPKRSRSERSETRH